MTVHYIWAGHLNNDMNQRCCQLGPISLAKTKPGVNIIMWVSNNAIDTARGLFKNYENIIIRSIEKTFDSDELISIKPYIESIRTLWALMSDQKSYVAQKDLWSLAIMAEYGGYFFDCTTTFTQVEELLPVDDFKILLGQQSKCHITNFNFTDFADADIWAFAARETGHPLFMEALVNLLEVCRKPESAELYWLNEMTGIACEQYKRTIVEKYPYETQLAEATWASRHLWYYTLKGSKGGQVLKLAFDGNRMIKYHMAFWKRPLDTIPSDSQEGYLAYQMLLSQQHDFRHRSSGGTSTSLVASIATLGLLPAPTYTVLDSSAPCSSSSLSPSFDAPTIAP